MGREFKELSAELDQEIRRQIARESDLADAAMAARWLLMGSVLPFYPRAWLAYLERIVQEGGPPERLYFVVQEREARKLLLVPMANEVGSIDRANRECGLTFPENSDEADAIVIDYPNFYYAFTPQHDPLLANLDEGPTHFGVPLAVDDLRFETSGESGQAACSNSCLALGAVWHYLNRQTNDRFATIRLKIRKMPYPRVTGRIVIQFRRGLFAADFRLPSSTNIPTLGNPELLYESTALRAPAVYPRATLRLRGFLGLAEVGRTLKAAAIQMVSAIGTASIVGIAWIVTLLLSFVWLFTWIFPFVEMTGWQGARAIWHLLGAPIGFESWAHSLRAIALFAIAAFLCSILYTTHMDKIFNMLFWLCPRGHRMWLAEKLAKRVSERDRELIAQDTFRKRALWAVRRLLYWSAYIVMAFASVQIALNAIYGLENASAGRIVMTLLEQAAINVPLILYVLVRVPGLIDKLDLVADGIVSAQLLFWFHAAMVLIVIKGIYRIWSFTVDASPHAFYRRLPVTNRHVGGEVDIV